MTATTCAACCWPTGSVPLSGRRSARRSRRRSTSGIRGGRRPAAAAATRWPPACSSRCCASSACSGCSAPLLPLPAIVPILLYIGLLIGAQAFQFTPRVHAAAVIAALIPNMAAWAAGMIDNALGAAGTSAGEVGEAALQNNGVVYNGLNTLGQGAILAGLLLGAIVAFIIDKRLISAAAFAVVGAGAHVHRPDPRPEGRLERQPRGGPGLRVHGRRARAVRADPAGAARPRRGGARPGGRARRCPKRRRSRRRSPPRPTRSRNRWPRPSRRRADRPFVGHNFPKLWPTE